MLILTVFFLLSDLSKGFSDGLLVLGVQVSMFSVIECSVCSVSSSCSAISFSILKFVKKSLILQDESQSSVRE